MKDLIVVTADSYQEKVMEALLPRIPVLSGTRQFTYDIIKNPGHDSGSYNGSHELLQSFINQYHFALVVFDFEGTGCEHLTRDEMENNVQNLLNRNGWKDRNNVIVIKPELENWMWIDNSHIERAIGWESMDSLYTWARQNGYIQPGKSKPERPKETLEKALRISETSKSASIYRKIAANVSYLKCEDTSFQKLIQQIQSWFPKI
jgi:hypothetical protein